MDDKMTYVTYIITVAKITVNNSMCRIEEISPQLKKALTEALRYENSEIAFEVRKLNKKIDRLKETTETKRFSAKSTNEKKIRALEVERARLMPELYIPLFDGKDFPTGLLPRVLKLAEDHKSQIMIRDMRIEPKLGRHKFVLKTSFPELRYYQKTPARLIKEEKRGINIAPTGTGKTMTAAKMIWELGLNTLVITPGKGISDNMVDTLTHFFGKGQVEKLTTKKCKLKAINVVNIQALVRMDPKLFKDIECVIIDEFHHAAADTYQKVNEKHLANAYYRIGLTATNFRNDGADLALEAVLSKVLYTYSIEQAIKDGYLVKPEFHWIENEGSPGNNYQHEYKEHMVYNLDRHMRIAEICEKHPNDSVIILVQHVEHGEALKELIPDAEFLHGEEKDSVRQNVMDKFRKGIIKRLIGTSVIGEGIDLPIANVLVMAGGGKAKSTIMQNVGRVLRPFSGKKKALVYDFRDRGTEYLGLHSELREEIYEQYDIEEEVPA